MGTHYKYSRNLELTYDANPNENEIPYGYITVDNPNKTIQKYRDNNLPWMNRPETILISNKKFRIVGFEGQYLKNRSAIFYKIIVYVFTLNKNIQLYIPIEQVAKLLMDDTFVNGESPNTYSLLFQNNDLIFVRESLDNVLYANNVPIDEEGNITQSKTKKRIPKNKLQIGHIYEDDKGNQKVFLGEYEQRTFKVNNKLTRTTFEEKAYVDYFGESETSKHLFWIPLLEEDKGTQLSYEEFKTKYLDFNFYIENNSIFDASYRINKENSKLNSNLALNESIDMYNRLLDRLENKVPVSPYSICTIHNRLMLAFKPMVDIGELVENSEELNTVTLEEDIFNPNTAYKDFAKHKIAKYVISIIELKYFTPINDEYKLKQDKDYYMYTDSKLKVNPRIMQFLSELSTLNLTLEEATDQLIRNYPQFFNECNYTLMRFGYNSKKINPHVISEHELKMGITRELLNYSPILMELL